MLFSYQSCFPLYLPFQPQKRCIFLSLPRKKSECERCIQLSVTPRTVACQAPLSMAFSRQEYLSGLPFPPPGNLPNPGIEPMSLALQADSLPSEPPGKPPGKAVSNPTLKLGRNSSLEINHIPCCNFLELTLLCSLTVYNEAFVGQKFSPSMY